MLREKLSLERDGMMSLLAARTKDGRQAARRKDKQTIRKTDRERRM